MNNNNSFNNIIGILELSYLSDTVPMIMGHAGIGKSALVEEFKNYMKEESGLDMESVTIFGSILKEGEITGLPVTREDNHGHLINDYSLYHGIRKLWDIYDNGQVPILFVDELNRCDLTTQQELMQPLLTREINGNKLPPNTFIVACGNNEDDKDDSGLDYQVNVMNPALKDRFVLVDMNVNPQEWITWGSKINKDLGTTNIHEDVLKFIATKNEVLHRIEADTDVFPTPRAWDSVSRALRAFESKNKILINNKKEPMKKSLLRTFMYGRIGSLATQEFFNFMDQQTNPLIDVDDIFTGSPLSKDMIKRIESEGGSPIRFLLSSRLLVNHMLFMSESELKTFSDRGRSQNIQNFATFLSNAPSDTAYAIINETRTNNLNVFNEIALNMDVSKIILDLEKVTNRKNELA